MRPVTDTEPTPPRANLLDIALLFLRLGFTAFGGPAAHIAIMEDEVVRRRRWITHERFLDMLGAANLIPGPSSSELAIFIGYEQAGLRGLVIAGTCFILPAALMTALIAWAYVRFGSLPRASSVLYGIKPVVIAIVAQALWGLVPKAVKSKWLGVLGALTATVGSFATLIAIEAIVGIGADQAGQLHLFDGEALNWRAIRIPADPRCRACGSDL